MNGLVPLGLLALVVLYDIACGRLHRWETER